MQLNCCIFLDNVDPCNTTYIQTLEVPSLSLEGCHNSLQSSGMSSLSFSSHENFRQLLKAWLNYKLSCQSGWQLPIWVELSSLEDHGGLLLIIDYRLNHYKINARISFISSNSDCFPWFSFFVENRHGCCCLKVYL